MNTYKLDAPAPPEKDRSMWLVAFGVVLLCFGGFCALLTGLMIIMAIAAPLMGPVAAQQGMQTGPMLAGSVVYGLMAAWFVSAGYGSFRARRWARSIILAVSWLGLVCGGGGSFGMVFFMPELLKAMERQSQSQLPPGFGHTLTVLLVTLLFTFYVIGPSTLLLFYSGRNVKATCEYRNPEPSWTDKVPIAVLIQIVLLTLYAVGIFSMAGYRFATPFFGMALTGLPGAVAIFSISACCALLARGSYRLQPMAWWGTVALVLFWGASACVTLALGNIMDFYTAMGMTEVQLDMIRPMAESGAMQSYVLWATPLWLVGIMGFFLYTKRYFVGQNEDGFKREN